MLASSQHEAAIMHRERALHELHTEGLILSLRTLHQPPRIVKLRLDSNMPLLVFLLELQSQNLLHSN